jgi:hypothetical protein
LQAKHLQKRRFSAEKAYSQTLDCQNDSLFKFCIRPKRPIQKAGNQRFFRNNAIFPNMLQDIHNRLAEAA